MSLMQIRADLQRLLNQVDELISDKQQPRFPSRLPIHRPLDHATLFYRFDPEKKLQVDADGIDVASLVSTGWSYPNRQIASPMLRASNPRAHHLAYTVYTHFTRYEGIHWMLWADKNGVNREDAFYHASEPLEYSKRWNHSHSLSPDQFRSIYIAKQNGHILWQDAKKSTVPVVDGDRLWLGQVDPFFSVIINGRKMDVTTSLDIQPGVFEYDQYLYWSTIPITETENIEVQADGDVRSSGKIPAGDDWRSRIDRPNGGPGNWLMNVSHPSYRKFILEDRPRYLDEVFREHFKGVKLFRREFEGLYIDDAPLDVSELEQRGGIAEEFSQEKYWRDSGSLARELWWALQERFEGAYVHCNVGNWHWKYLKHFAKECPSVYFDRMIEADNVTVENVVQLEDTLHQFEAHAGKDAFISIDGSGGDSNCLDDARKRLFLCVYYLVIPSPERYMLSMMQNGDKDRSDWSGRHFHKDVMTKIGKPIKRMSYNPPNKILSRNFEFGRVEIDFTGSIPVGRCD